MKHKILVAAGLAAAFGVSAIALAQQPPAVTPMTPEMNPSYSFARPEADYVRREVMIPMRDGVKLSVYLFLPKDDKGPWPAVFEQRTLGVPEHTGTQGRNAVRGVYTT